MDQLYTPLEAARLAGVSTAALRGYTIRYPEQFSTHATPPKGQPRMLTREDVRVLRFIAQLTTGQGATHEDVRRAFDAGDLAAFDWQPPQQVPAGEQFFDEEEQAPMSTALALVGQLQSVTRILESELSEARRQVSDGLKREGEQYQRYAELSRQVGQIEGERNALRQQLDGTWNLLRQAEERAAAVQRAQDEMAALKAQLEGQRKPWWKRLFGG